MTETRHALATPLVELGAQARAYVAQTVAANTRRAYRVPKRDLVFAAVVVLQQRRLQIAADLEHAAALVRELQDYRVKIDPHAAHDSYAAWREGQHDDLVFALSLCLSWNETQPSRPFTAAVGGERRLFASYVPDRPGAVVEPTIAEALARERAWGYPVPQQGRL